MKMHWTDIAAAAVMAGAGCGAVYAGLQRSLRKAAERQQSTDRHVAALAAAVRALQARMAEPGRAAPSAQEIDSMAAAAEGAGIAKLQEPKPETLAVITAAATAFLGRTARIRSARLAPAPPDSVSPWSQQGRVIVQTSHNLRTRD